MKSGDGDIGGEKENDDVEITRYRNIEDVGAFPELKDFKIEVHPGACLEYLMDQIDTLSTLRKITAGEPESYAEAVVHNMRSAYEIIGMIECIRRLNGQTCVPNKICSASAFFLC